ncbi:hypothetical protein KC345_g1513 [Hortaea werneckii]|nr:hypothetical protein KC345_g1513 [Hortaea werneckii]
MFTTLQQLIKNSATMEHRNHTILVLFFLILLAYVFLVMDDEWTQFCALFALAFVQFLGYIHDFFFPGSFNHFTLIRCLLRPYEPYYSRFVHSRLGRDAIEFGEEIIYLFNIVIYLVSAIIIFLVSIIIFAVYGKPEQQEQHQQHFFEEKNESLWEREEREKELLQKEFERDIANMQRVARRAKGIVEDGDWTNKWEEYEAKKAQEKKQAETTKASQSAQASSKDKTKRKSSKKSKRALEAESEAIRQKWLDKLLIDTTKMNYNWGSGFGDPFEVDNGGPFEEDKQGRPIIPAWYIAEQEAKANAAAAAKAAEERKQAEMAEKEAQAKVAAKLAAKKSQDDQALVDFKKTFGAPNGSAVAVRQCEYCTIHHHAIGAERAGHARLFGEEPQPVIKTIFGHPKAMYCTCCGWPYHQPGQPVSHGFTAVPMSRSGGAAVVQPAASTPPPPPPPPQQQQQSSSDEDAAGKPLDPAANPLGQMDVRTAREAIRTTMLEVVSKTTEMQKAVRMAANKRAAWQAIISNERLFFGNLAVVMQWIQEWAIPDKQIFDAAKIPREEVKRLKLQVEVLQPMQDFIDDAPGYTAELAAPARRISTAKRAEFAR